MAAVLTGGNSIPPVQEHQFEQGQIISAAQTVCAPEPGFLPYLKWELLTVKSLAEFPWVWTENIHGVQGYVNSTMFSLAEEYVHSDWYLREFTNSMTEKLLKNKERGTFIVRGNSQKPNEIVFSVKFDKVYHYSFKRHGQGLWCNIEYKTVEEFVQVCRNNAMLMGQKLTSWIKKSDINLPEVQGCYLIMQGLNLRIVSGSKSVAVEDFVPQPDCPWCLPLRRGSIFKIIKATRDPKWYVGQDISNSSFPHLEKPEGLIPANLIECYIPDWFHGIMDRVQAEQLLMNTMRDGTFMVRERSKSPGHFAISVWCPDKILHIPIIFENGKLSTGQNYELPRFDSLLDMVNHYLGEGMFWTISGECVRIVFPLSRKECNIPDEIQQMDLQSINTYFDALKQGKERVIDIRLMIVGHFGAGKTTLAERLMGNAYRKVESTNGIDIHVRQCKFSLTTGRWQKSEGEDDFHAIRLSRLFEDKEIDLSKVNVMADSASCSKQGETLSKLIGDASITPSEILSVAGQNETESNYVDTRTIRRVRPENFEGGRKNSYDIATDSIVPRYKFSEGTLKALSSMKKRRSRGNEDKIGFISLWDFAGQFIFYSTHQVFLAPKALYLLVLDLSRSIDDFIEDEDFPVHSIDMQGRSVKDFGRFWLRSIHTFCNDLPGEPAVILVGTNKDKIKCEASERDAYVEKYFSTFREFIGDSPESFHLQPEQFAIDNTCESDVDLERLKLFIVDVARKQNHWKQEVPARWLPLERALHKLRPTSPIVSRQTIKMMDKEGDVKLENEDELSVFLRYHHAVGSLIYYEDEGMAECVILDPQWIVKAFRSLITAECFCLKQPQLQKYWKELKTYAKLNMTMIKEVWKQEDEEQFTKHSETLLLLMEKLDIIAKPTIYVEEESRVEEVDFFFVPSLLRSARMSVVDSVFTNRLVSTSKLCFVFDEGFVPPTLFHRMLAGCLSKYQVLKARQTVVLNCDTGAFNMDGYHYFLIQFYDCIISVKVYNMIGMEVQDSVCDQLRRLLSSLLQKELGRYKQSARFSVCIHCGQEDATGGPNRDLLNCKELLKHDRLPCFSHGEPHIVRADELLKYWFPDEIKKDGDPPRGQSWLERLDANVKRQSPSEKVLSKMAQCLGRNWEFVLIELGLHQTIIEQSKLDHANETAMQIFDSLMKWKQRFPNKATVETLINAVQQTKTASVDWETVKNIVDEI